MHCYPQAFLRSDCVLLYNDVRDLCGGETYSFAIFGGVVALRELQMCMALSVGIVQPNYFAVSLFLFAVVVFLFKVALIYNEVAIILFAVSIFLSEVGIFLIEVWICLFEVLIIPIAVEIFPSAIGIFLNVVYSFLLVVWLLLNVSKSYSFYLTVFGAGGSVD